MLIANTVTEKIGKEFGAKLDESNTVKKFRTHMFHKNTRVVRKSLAHESYGQVRGRTFVNSTLVKHVQSEFVCHAPGKDVKCQVV